MKKIVETPQVMKLLDAFKKDSGLTDEAIIKALTDMNAKAVNTLFFTFK